MAKDVIAGHVRRVSRNLLLLNLLVLGVVAAGFGAASGYYYNFFKGPFVVDRRDLLSPSTGWFARRYVTTEFRSLGNTWTANYLAAHMAGWKILLVKVNPPPGTDPQARTRLTGCLVPVSAEVKRDVVDVLVNQVKGVDGRVLDVMFDAGGGYATPGWVGLGVGVPVAVVCLWNIEKALRRLVNPRVHPSYRKLSAFGDPRAVAGSISADFAGGAEAIGPVTVGKGWVVHASKWGVAATPLRELVWAYRQGKSRLRKGAPPEKMATVLVRDRGRGAFRVRMPRAQVKQLFSALKKKVPWMIAGVDPQLEEAWRTDHRRVVAVADARRQRHAKALSAVEGVVMR